MLSKTLNSPPKVGGRRGMKASVATTAGLSAQRSTEGLSLKEGEVVLLFRIIPPPLRSSPYVRGTIQRFGKQLYYHLIK